MEIIKTVLSYIFTFIAGGAIGAVFMGLCIAAGSDDHKPD